MRGAIFLCLAGLAACDSKAKASDPAGAKAETKSKEFESCGTTMHCESDLRCFDQVCRRTARSTVGDYWAAVGAAAHARGEHDAAIEAYESAIRQYNADKIPNGHPPDIDCGYGAALAGDKAKNERAEKGAQILHRCLLAVPAGSALRERALAELATLNDYGLQPLALGGTKLAERYTKAVEPKAPTGDKVSVNLTADQQPKSWSKITDKVNESKAALIDCWEQYSKATKKDTVAANLTVKSYFYQDPNYADEEGGGFLTDVKFDAAGGGPEGQAQGCVKKALEADLKKLRFGEGFTSKITVTLKP
ncbi:MAG: hypothetical protein KF773_32005 [Deltaproteobacteria bacterium]|nr:hypothetical protein [Deltaproteobacteria bacterium]MCW5801556.1 hypothetical protein [Deltaproteobacteria bacterium]